MASSVLLDRVSAIVVRDLTLRIAPGESVALIGRSGAGKTTVLRLLNGLCAPSAGSVLIDDVPLTGDLVARRRRIGTILQAPALFPHRIVFDNIATVPRLLGWDDARIRDAASAMLARLEMPFERFAARMPRSLSGGEQQRVGIARAMIAEPPLRRQHGRGGNRRLKAPAGSGRAGDAKATRIIPSSAVRSWRIEGWRRSIAASASSKVTGCADHERWAVERGNNRHRRESRPAR